jgi:hypothetical protein
LGDSRFQDTGELFLLALGGLRESHAIDGDVQDLDDPCVPVGVHPGGDPHRPEFQLGPLRPGQRDRRPCRERVLRELLGLRLIHHDGGGAVGHLAGPPRILVGLGRCGAPGGHEGEGGETEAIDHIGTITAAASTRKHETTLGWEARS